MLARAWVGWGKRNMVYLCYPLRDSTNRFFELPQAVNEATERTRSNTEQASRTLRAANARCLRSVSGVWSYHKTRRR